ncbi:aspartate aminotransferase family protein [Nibricoccus sp. IMCC34717]|uniref:aspartate aminotransferase family protein n=1 Tax=Nibricoccus sp. IMCC34717 TaxID=3034021 RepID=UPI00384F2A0D
MRTKQSELLLRRNEQWIPGGLASLNRKADPCISFRRGQGAHIWDYDDNKYIDYHFGFAPYILGHNDADQNRAVIEALASGASNFGSGTSEGEGELAHLFLECVSSADLVQFVNTGSEATAQAIRIARAATGRGHIIKMQGGYNGHHNMVATNLMTPTSLLGHGHTRGRELPLVPITAGIPPEEASLIHVVEFNDLEAVKQVASKYPIALLITEPCLQNIGVVPPAPGYLQGLRAAADQFGFLLCFDEVKTGFRAALGGFQSVSGVRPDLSTFGKAIANGFPLAAVAGKREYMNLAISDDPSRRVLLAGTYNCHPVPVAAALACLTKLMDPKVRVYDRLEFLGARLQLGLESIYASHSLRARVSRIGSALCTYFMSDLPGCWSEIANNHNFALDLALRRELITRGIYQIPIAAKQASLCFAHSEADIDRTLQQTDEALSVLKTTKSDLFV